MYLLPRLIVKGSQIKPDPDLPFDKQLELFEIFSTREIQRIVTALSRLLDCSVSVVEPNALPDPECQREAILWELEPVGYLEAKNANTNQLRGAADIFVILLKEAVRFRMASDLHLETVVADFDALQKRHIRAGSAHEQSEVFLYEDHLQMMRCA